ncbi:VOC family protein [Psychrobacillus sp. NPDC058041]|uniref:VOC family protein n=1 Tax=Psychrobacillus sp. NPDC058041 TaxID=3346310 RepID=UPI0036DA5AA9
MNLVERIDTVCLKVSDVNKVSQWYQEVLGLQEQYKENHYVILSVGTSGVPLTLEKGSTETNENTAYPIFFSSNIEHTFNVLTENGVKVTEIQKDGLNTFFNFCDLDGNKLQICYWE